MTTALSILIGVSVGAIAWWLYIRPMQQNAHERRRRQYGLTPKRELPEDQR